MTKFHMVAGFVHRLRVGHKQRLHCGVQHQAEQGLLPGHDCVNSALLVKPTFLDPTSGSSMTWSTLTRCSSDINMLTTPKQQPHKRELHPVFEGNKQDNTLGPTTVQQKYKSTCLSKITI
eukprot:6491525-Amphidinium_carterae.1